MAIHAPERRNPFDFRGLILKLQPQGPAAVKNLEFAFMLSRDYLFSLVFLCLFAHMGNRWSIISPGVDKKGIEERKKLNKYPCGKF